MKPMRCALLLLLAAAPAPAQEGGRDDGTEGKPMTFVRWRRLAESGRIYNAAWASMEPHFGVVARRRLFDLDGDAERCETFFRENADSAILVAFGADAEKRARAALPGAVVLGVGPGLLVDTTADRAQFAALLRTFRPGARRIALFGPAEELPGFEVKRCATPADAIGCDLAWASEGASVGALELRRALDAGKVPLVSTSDALEDGFAALTVRPHEESVGRALAALALRCARDGAAPARTAVARMRVTLDLKACRAAGHAVPFAALARADAVRR